MRDRRAFVARGDDGSPLWRFLPLPGLLLATMITLALLIGDARSRTYHGNLYHFVVTYRATVQIVVQIISFALGAIHVYVLTTLVNFFTRLSLRKVPSTLDSLKLWNSMTSPRMDWSLPGKLTAILGTFLLVTIVPPALWAVTWYPPSLQEYTDSEIFEGALTPVTTTALVDSTIQVPFYGSDPTGIYWNRTWDPFADPNITRTAKGSFSYVPGSAMAGIVLDSAASASARNSSVRTHTKNDASRFSYFGRSYGVGSSAGLAELGRRFSSGTRSYKYFEAGYLSKMTCIRNDTNLWVVSLAWESDDGTYPDTYLVSGVVPNNSSEGYASVSLGGDSSTVVALVGACRNNRNVFALATGYDEGSYTALNNTQCDVTFIPTLFEVKVDVSRLLITVTPQQSTADFDPTTKTTGIGLGRLAQYIVREVTLTSMINTSLYTSVLGDTFISNVANVAAATNTSMDDVSTVTSAVRDSLESMLDDMLLAVSSAQLMIAGSITPSTSLRQTEATIDVNAVKLGQTGYIYGIFVLNAVLLLLWCAEALRTHGWRSLPPFDYRDVKNVIISTSMGGDAVAVAAKQSSPNVSVGGTDGRTKVVLERQEGGLALVSAYRGGIELSSKISVSSLPQLKTATPKLRYSRLKSGEDTVGLHVRSESGNGDGAWLNNMDMGDQR